MTREAARGAMESARRRAVLIVSSVGEASTRRWTCVRAPEWRRHRLHFMATVVGVGARVGARVDRGRRVGETRARRVGGGVGRAASTSTSSAASGQGETRYFFIHHATDEDTTLETVARAHGTTAVTLASYNSVVASRSPEGFVRGGEEVVIPVRAAALAPSAEKTTTTTTTTTPAEVIDVKREVFTVDWVHATFFTLGFLVGSLMFRDGGAGRKSRAVSRARHWRAF